MKQTLFQTSILVGVSTLIAIIFQWFNPNAIPYLAAKVDVVQTKNELTDNESSDIEYISLELAKTLFDDGVLFVDAREPEYFLKGHIPNALNNDHFLKLAYIIDSLQSRNTMIIAYCDGDDCGSSEDLAYDLLDHGFKKVMVFLDGWEEWTNANYPVEK